LPPFVSHFAMPQHGACDGWRAAVRALTAALQNAPVEELIQAKAELTEVLADVTQRARQEGSDPVLEAVHAAGHRAAQDRHSPDKIHRLLKGLTARLRVRVDDADAGNCSFSASARGEWGIQGKKYKFSASAVETEGKIVSGKVDVEGLGFSAGDGLKSGKFDCDAEAADWAQRAGVQDMPVQDVTRVVVAALDVLAKKRAKGVADIDVLKLSFDLMKSESGVPCPERVTKPKRRLTTKQASVPTPAPPEAAAAASQASAKARQAEEEAAAEVCATEAVASELSRSRPAPSVDVDKPQVTRAGPGDLLDAFVQSVSSSIGSGPSTVGVEPRGAGSGGAGDERGENDNGRGAVSDVQSAPALPLKDGASMERLESMAANSDEENCVGTEFVGKAALEAMKAKLASGGEPTAIELVQLLDVDNLPEDEDMVPLELTKLGEEFPTADHRSFVDLLISKHGQRKAAELLVSAGEDDAPDALAEDSEGHDEEGEDGEEECDEDGDDEEDPDPGPAQKKSRIA